MPKVTVYNQNGQTVGEMDLKDEVFGIEPNPHVLHQAVVLYQASLRQGTHATRNRALVRGGGKKPWRQKGTGRARQGSIRAPQWVGGGVVFGPTPRSYTFTMPKKMRRLAIRSAFSSKVKENELLVLDTLSLEKPKTKEFVQILKNLNVNRKALVIIGEKNETLSLSARNIPGVKLVPATGVNVYDLLNVDRVVMTKDAVNKVEEVFA
ncbi:ribosomal protein L4 [[Clostridium] ultunense Esp]|uniref:50S ribosomal protein L4 n=1 Tax=Thermicanus aegyptius TaxID=94009 RepID=UPI0002B6F398|nr:50S ribosomal protein L4 [Thermicanus aegyptius]CCQ93749.1 ribosomal protein L4 [[Clostridium] ultunense Esp]